MAELSPWRRRALVIPPNSLQTWLQLVTWEIWMGVLLCIVLGLGVTMIVTSPDRIVKFIDLSACYAPPPIPIPCERTIYLGGLLNMAFSGLCGVMLLGVGLWFVWELWRAVEPRPITDDFLRLLNDSFGHSWRNPLKWPWGRLFWAYGFTSIGAALTVMVAMLIWTATQPAPPAAKIETSQTFRANQ
jgi:hypothetical protein